MITWQSGHSLAIIQRLTLKCRNEHPPTYLLEIPTMKTLALAFTAMLLAAPAFAEDVAAPVTPPAPPPPAMMPAGAPAMAPAPAAVAPDVKADTQQIHDTTKVIHDKKVDRRAALKAGDKAAAKEAGKEIRDLKKARHNLKKERRHDIKAHRAGH